MDVRFAVMATDQVNLHGSRIPAQSLAEGLEKHLLSSLEDGVLPGTPMHISHDMHRPVGWSSQLGLLSAGHVVAAVGYVHLTETDEERGELERHRQRYFAAVSKRASAPVRDAIFEVLKGEGVDVTDATFTESGELYRAGIARELLPQFFDHKSRMVDKDGLAEYSEVCRTLQARGAGVFLDEKRGLLFFAHRFFRRSLSHRNHLNPYFLDSFHRAASEMKSLRFRVRLDPDIVGLAKSAHGRVEFEFWHGHKFNRDIESIGAGVAVHKADESTRFYEAIEELQVWWKAPEKRKLEGGGVASQTFRTLEMEELPLQVSLGEGEDVYGCRYVHSEFDPSVDAITHFDGAIRAYRSDAFEARRATQMNRAGKYAEYTKIFRIDGPLEVSDWQSLCGSYFRGNPLLAEYFGTEPIVQTEPESTSSVRAGELPQEPLLILTAYIARRLTVDVPTVTCDKFQMVDDENVVPLIEWCWEADVCHAIEEICDVSGLRRNLVQGRDLNLPRIVIPSDASVFHGVLDKLSEALARDLAADRLDEVSLAIAWPWSEVSVSVALAGAVSAVLRALPILRNNIVLSAAPSSWMKDVKVAAAQGCAPSVRLSDLGANVVATGILAVPLIRLGDAD